MSEDATDDENRLLDTPSAAVLLRCSESFLRKNYLTLGIPYVRLGASVRFRIGAVSQWLTEQEAKSLATIDRPA